MASESVGQRKQPVCKKPAVSEQKRKKYKRNEKHCKNCGGFFVFYRFFSYCVKKALRENETPHGNEKPRETEITVLNEITLPKENPAQDKSTARK